MDTAVTLPFQEDVCALFVQDVGSGFQSDFLEQRCRHEHVSPDPIEKGLLFPALQYSLEEVLEMYRGEETVHIVPFWSCLLWNNMV